jgi:hypothetical protein
MSGERTVGPASISLKLSGKVGTAKPGLPSKGLMVDSRRNEGREPWAVIAGEGRDH